MPSVLPILQGRGAADNPVNRFERLHVEDDFEHWNPDPEAEPATTLQTEYYVDTSRTIIATNDSPDVSFSHSLNAYRGCTHGCIYCYARPGHEYLGFSAGLDFETKVMVKPQAPQLLREAMMKRSWQPTVLGMSGVTDCYQPVEKKLCLTRRCLQVLAEFRNPVSIVTKNHLVTRDIDLLQELAAHRAVCVFMSITTLDPALTRVMEPRTSVPQRRLNAVRKLADAGIPVGVLMAPVIPGLTDSEVFNVVSAAAVAGAKSVGYVALRLPLAVAPLFEDWLGRHFPDRKDKVLNRIRELRGGKLNDANFGSRMTGHGIWGEQLSSLFGLARKRAGLVSGAFPKPTTAAFRRPSGPQMTLWE